MLTRLHLVCLFGLAILALSSGCGESTTSPPNPYADVFTQVFLDDISIKGIRLGAPEADIQELINHDSCWVMPLDVSFSCDGKVEVRIADIECELEEIGVWNGSSGWDGEFYVDTIKFKCPYGEKSLQATISHKYGNDFTYTEPDLTIDDGVAERAYEDWFWEFPSGASVTLRHYVYGQWKDDLHIILSAGLGREKWQLIDKLKLEDI